MELFENPSESGQGDRGTLILELKDLTTLFSFFTKSCCNKIFEFMILNLFF